MASRPSSNAHLLANAHDAGECSRCSEPATSVCGRCGDFYCSERCQRMDWHEHRRICIELPGLMKAERFFASRDADAKDEGPSQSADSTSKDAPAAMLASSFKPGSTSKVALASSPASTSKVALASSPASTSKVALASPPASTSKAALAFPPASTSKPVCTAQLVSTSLAALKGMASFNGSSGSVVSSPASTSSAGSNGSPSVAFDAMRRGPIKVEPEPIKSWRQKPSPPPLSQQPGYLAAPVGAGRGRRVVFGDFSPHEIFNPFVANPRIGDNAKEFRAGNPFAGERRPDATATTKDVRSGNPFAGERRQDASFAGERRQDASFAGERRRDTSFAGERRQDASFAGERRQDASFVGERRRDASSTGERRQDSPLKSSASPQVDLTTNVSPPSTIKSGHQVILTGFQSTNRVYICNVASQSTRDQVSQQLQQYVQANPLKRLAQRPKPNTFVLVPSEKGHYARGRVVSTGLPGSGAETTVCLELTDIGKQVQRPYDGLFACPDHLARLLPCTLMVNLYMVTLYREMPATFGEPFEGRPYILKSPKELKRGAWVELVCPRTGTSLNKTIAKLIRDEQKLRKKAPAHDGKTKPGGAVGETAKQAGSVGETAKQAGSVGETAKQQVLSFDETKYQLAVQYASLGEKNNPKASVEEKDNQKASVEEKNVQKASVEEKNNQKVSFAEEKLKTKEENSFLMEKYKKMVEFMMYAKQFEQNASFDEKLKMPEPKDSVVEKKLKKFDEKKLKMPEQEASFDEKKLKMPEQEAYFHEKKMNMPEQEASFDEKKLKMPEQEASFDEKKLKMPEQESSFDEKKLKMPEQEAYFDEKKMNMPGQEASFDEKKMKMPEQEASFDVEKMKMPEPNDSIDEKLKMLFMTIPFDELESMMPALQACFGKKKGPAESPVIQKEHTDIKTSNGKMETMQPGKPVESLQNGINGEPRHMDAARSSKSLENDANGRSDLLPGPSPFGFFD